MLKVSYVTKSWWLCTGGLYMLASFPDLLIRAVFTFLCVLTTWSDYGWSLGENANLAEKLKIEFLEI